MTDISQWRRRLPPLRIPATPNEHDDRESTGDTSRSPVTPKKKLKPKISSYFSHHQSSLHHVKSEPNIVAVGIGSSAQTSPIVEHAFRMPHQPEAEQLMESLARRLMSDNVRCPQPSDGSSVLAIIEAYRHLLDKNVKLQQLAHDEKLQKRHAEVELLRAQQNWTDEREEYKTEVKRLELLISKGSSGVAGVIQSRQNSVLRKRTNATNRTNRTTRSRVTVEQPVDIDDDKETVFEFLERTRIDNESAKTTPKSDPPNDGEGSVQTVVVTPTPKTRAASPSQKMRILSEEMSPATVNNEEPFATPPFSYLAQRFEQQPLVKTKTEGSVGLGLTESRRKASFAASSNYSNFSSNGDALPDEEADDTIRELPVSPDMQEIKRLAELIARMRGLNSAALVNKIYALCDESPVGVSSSSGSPIDAFPKTLELRDNQNPLTINEVHPTAILSLPNGVTLAQITRKQRRFSFDYGDDSGFGSLQSELAANKSERARALRRSHSAMDCVPTTAASSPDRGESSRPPSPFLPRASMLSSTFPAGTSSLLTRGQRDSSSSGAVTATPRRVSAATVDSLTSLNDQHSPVTDAGAERDPVHSSSQSTDSGSLSIASSIDLATAAAITAISLRPRLEER
ncbi:hypothetical protein MBLNU457_g2772t1 [Dothideomycetes sp. NU457]